MYKISYVLLIVLCGIGLDLFSQSSNAWKLVWQDEFEYQGLPDSSKWTPEQGFRRNREAQYYTAKRLKNARVENGYLILEAHKEKFSNALRDPDSNNKMRRKKWAEYTSASLTTRELPGFLYGRMEVRAKLPTGRGTWPAIWMLGENIREVGWPRCGEIDIMENVGFDPNELHAYVHTKAYNHTIDTQKGTQTTMEPGPYQDFHVYAIEWTPEKIDFFIDGKQHFSFANEHKSTAEWPFDQPHFLILNIAIGGTWGGREGIDNSIFPQQMMIDYVRYYQ